MNGVTLAILALLCWDITKSTLSPGEPTNLQLVSFALAAIATAVCIAGALAAVMT